MAPEDVNTALEQYTGRQEVSEDVRDALKSLSATPPLLKTLSPKALAHAGFAAASMMSQAWPGYREMLCNVGDLAMADIAAFSTSDLVMLAWAAAAATTTETDFDAGPLLEMLGDQVCTHPASFHAEELTRIIFAFAQARLLHMRMMDATASEVMWKVDQMDAATTTSLVASCSELGYENATLYHWVASRVVDKMQIYSLVQLTDICVGLAAAKVKHQKLVDKIAEVVSVRGDRLTEADLERLLKALGSVGAFPRSAAQLLYHSTLAGTVA